MGQKFWAPVRSETVVSVLVDCSVNVTHVVALLSAQYTKARVGYCNGSATNANIMEAFLAYTFFLHRVLTFPASVPQKILTVEVQNPAPLLGLLAPPCPPHLILGSRAPQQQTKNTTLRTFLPNIKCGGQGGGADS